ncbi:protein toll-like [Mytilus edulis]|uniref:protein toll-like n=1 Tax=Mytilus edulis TaxID=6550 RepID=UPI0039EE8A0C
MEQFKFGSKNFEEKRKLTCEHPPFLRGRRIFNISADLFVCNISMKDKCPFNCSCFEQPSRSRVVVNCSMRGKYKLPSVLPERNRLHIDLSHNSITVFEYRTYLDKTYSIDLSYNRIKRVDPFIFEILKISNINLKHNGISQIHKNVQLFKNKRTVQFGNITITCSCEMKWIQVWLENQNRRRRGNNVITCRFPDKTLRQFLSLNFVPIKNRDQLCNIYLTRKYEIYLLSRNFKSRYFGRFNNKTSQQPNKFDVYLSLNAENYNTMKWVTTGLVKNLERNGFRVCLPPRDFIPGDVQVEQIFTEVAISNSYLVILSDDYLKSQINMIEWNQIWTHFKSNNPRRIVVVNYDILDSSHIKDRRLKAFVRVGQTFDFCNFDNKLLEDLEIRLRTNNRQIKSVSD